MPTKSYTDSMLANRAVLGRILLGLVLVLAVRSLFADTSPLPIEAPRISSAIVQYTDETKNRSVEDVALLMQDHAKSFQPIDQTYSSFRFWYRLSVAPYALPWILNIQNRSLAYLALYSWQEGTWQTLTCSSLALSSHPRCIMPPLNQATTYLIAVEFSNTTSLELHADPNPPPSRGLSDSGLVLNLFMIGFGMALIFYLGIFSWSSRDSNYIYFALYAGTGVAYSALGVGIVQIMQWPNAWNAAQSWLGCAATIFVALFTINHLQTSRLAPNEHKVFVAIALLTLLQMIVYGLSQDPLFNLAYTPELMGLIFMVTAIWTSIKVRHQGIKVVNYFLAAWVVFAFFTLLILTRQYGVWESESVLAKSLLRIGTTALLSILALSVAKRAHQERQLLLQSLEAHNNQLESEVKARTLQIIEQQQALIQTAKMASIGEIAAGIAHEINNPLAIISGYAYSLNSQAKKGQLSPQTVLNYHQRIEAAVERIAVIVRSLRVFSAQDQSSATDTVEIKPVIEDVINLVADRFRGLDITLKLPQDIPELPVQGSVGQIEQVLINLLNNAFDAVVKSKGAWVELAIAIDAGKVSIHITDSGRGIAPGIVQKMFDPFFTTKEVGKGTGLGLSISKKIAESMHGSLSYDCCQGHTRFTLTVNSSVDEVRLRA